jgi:hypothetical protein
VYRTNVAPRDHERAKDVHAIAKGSSFFAVPPLLIIAITFVLPMTDGCDHVESPLSVASEGLASAGWIVPPFAAAVLLALVIAHSGMAGRPCNRPAFVVVGTLAAAQLVPLITAVVEDKSAAPTMVGGYLLVTACAGLLLHRARKRYGWCRLSRLIDVYVVSSLPIAFVVTITATYYGAILFIAAYAVLILERVTYQLQTGHTG